MPWYEVHRQRTQEWFREVEADSEEEAQMAVEGDDEPDLHEADEGEWVVIGINELEYEDDGE